MILIVLSTGTLLAGLAGCSPAPERPTSPATPPQGGVVPGDAPCQTDADCVPAGCCHPAACVAKASAPDCSAILCTQECRSATLDCGGACLCSEGKCAARLNDLAPGQPASAR
jgi:hypothetical protein